MFNQTNWWSVFNYNNRVCWLLSIIKNLSGSHNFIKIQYIDQEFIQAVLLLSAFEQRLNFRML